MQEPSHLSSSLESCKNCQDPSASLLRKHHQSGNGPNLIPFRRESKCFLEGQPDGTGHNNRTLSTEYVHIRSNTPGNGMEFRIPLPGYRLISTPSFLLLGWLSYKITPESLYVIENKETKHVKT